MEDKKMESNVGDDEEDDDDLEIRDEDILAVYDLDDEAGPAAGNYDDDDGDGDLPGVNDTSNHETGLAVVFKEHSEAVFCLASHPVMRDVVVSGGQDDRAYAWDLTTGNKLYTFTGHKDSVTHVTFTSSGKYLCTADMSGLVQVWKSDSAPTFTKTWSYDLELGESGSIEWLRWHPAPTTSVLLVGSSEDVWMFMVPGGECKVFTHGLEGAATAAVILPQGKRLFVGHAGGQMRCWDLKTCDTLYFIDGVGGAHTDQVSCMSLHHSAPVTATGSLDGSVKLINHDTGKVLQTFHPKGGFGAQGDEEVEGQSVEDVAFSESTPHLLASATSAGILNIWDINTSTARVSVSCEACITKLLWDDCLIYTGDDDGVVSVWDQRSGDVVRRYGDHASTVLDIDIQRDKRRLLYSSDDGRCHVYNLT